MTSAYLFTLLIFVQPANAELFDFDRPLDRGGSISVYMDRVRFATGERHVIAGDCMSACTIWLGYKHTCVMTDAVLWFHAAQDRWARFGNVNPWKTISVAGNMALIRIYPPRVRAVVAPWLQSPDFHTISGAELAKLGVPLCP